jgi:hypothetical protein
MAAFGAVVAFFIAQAASFGHGSDGDVVSVVGRLLSPGIPNLPACSGGGEKVILEYEVLYARPSSRLPHRIQVSCSCPLLKGSSRIKPARLTPVFATGELHDLHLRVFRASPGVGAAYPEEMRVGAVNIVQRDRPIPTQVSVVKGYDHEIVARLLERKLLELPCRSIQGEVALAVHLQIDGTGCVSSMKTESPPVSAVDKCVRQAAREWDFGYPAIDKSTGGRVGEMALVIVFPPPVDRARGREAAGSSRP